MLLPPLFLNEETGSDGLSNMPKVPLLMSGIAGIMSVEVLCSLFCVIILQTNKCLQEFELGWQSEKASEKYNPYETAVKHKFQFAKWT